MEDSENWKGLGRRKEVGKVGKKRSKEGKRMLGRSGKCRQDKQMRKVDKNRNKKGMKSSRKENT